MILHERYFGNLGGDGKVSGMIVELMTAAYGTVEPWLTRRQRWHACPVEHLLGIGRRLPRVSSSWV
jgi:hypothetical protein